MVSEEFLPTLPIPMIFPLELSPMVTLPPSFGEREENLNFSPVICLEQPLSKNHLSLLEDLRHTYKTSLGDPLWYPIFVGFNLVSKGRCGSLLNPNHCDFSLIWTFVVEMSFSHTVVTCYIRIGNTWGGGLNKNTLMWIFHLSFVRACGSNTCKEIIVLFFFESRIKSLTDFVKNTSLFSQKHI